MGDDLHATTPVYRAGRDLAEADGAVILLHGRGADAAGMLHLFEGLRLDTLHAVAPEAHNNTWYPHSFLASLDDNQPWLDSALAKINATITELLDAGIPADRIALLGFSQGACLASEFVARIPRRYGGLMALTGGVIGPPETQFTFSGDLDGTPIFLGTSDPDSHVPLSRVEQTRDIFTAMAGRVDLRVYPGMPHTINTEELRACREILTQMTAGGAP